MTQQETKKLPVFEEEGKYKIWYDEQEKVVCGKYWGAMDEEQAKNIFEAFAGFSQELPEGYSVLNDMTEAGSASLKARKYFIDLMKEKNLIKIAFWGGSQVNQAFISFILDLAGVDKVKYFISKTEALLWLKK